MIEKEQRRHPRRNFQELPWVFALKLDNSVKIEKPLRSEAKNISLGGLKFIANHKIALFEEVSLVFFHKESGKELSKARAKVVRLEEIDTGIGEKTYGVAVAFLTGESDALVAHFTPNNP